MDKSFVQMRNFMLLTETINRLNEEPMILSEVPTEGAPTRSILEDLSDAVFKMRAFTESREGDLGLGVELGMQRAADMIENVINRHAQKDR